MRRIGMLVLLGALIMPVTAKDPTYTTLEVAHISYAAYLCGQIDAFIDLSEPIPAQHTKALALRKQLSEAGVDCAQVKKMFDLIPAKAK